MNSPFSLLSECYADVGVSSIFSVEATIGAWLEVEAALATAQADAGLMTEDEATAIRTAAADLTVQPEEFWQETRNVGYPILPLVRRLSASLDEGPNGRVHLGATTQDIMDTALSMQMRRALQRIAELLVDFGDLLAGGVEQHRATMMAGRTHARQALPTTYGAKLAIYLAEVTRHLKTIRALTGEVNQVSLYGGAGSLASLGTLGPAIRASMAKLLGCEDQVVPWHVSRDVITKAQLGAVMAAATAGRLAREVVDLGRDEIAELTISAPHHYGASSTMPQKLNPVDCEAAIGMVGVLEALASAAVRAQQAGHERAAGEWHIEWFTIPHVLSLAAGAIAAVNRTLATIEVDQEAMKRNLDLNSGTIMAEAYMMTLVPMVGRERAHDLTYEASRSAVLSGLPLAEVLSKLSGLDVAPMLPQTYVGQVQATCSEALDGWSRVRGDTAR